MSFWDLSDGASAADGATEYEQPSGDITLLPDGCKVKAVIEDAKWDGEVGEKRLNLKWSVLAPDEHKNRKVFQKLWVADDDPNAKDAQKAAAKRDKAKRMLAAIDANCGGALARAGKMPTDDDLALNLTNKPMVIMVKVWAMPDRDNPGHEISGNWISAVATASAELAPGTPYVPKTPPAQAPQTGGGGYGGGSFGGDDIPF